MQVNHSFQRTALELVQEFVTFSTNIVSDPLGRKSCLASALRLLTLGCIFAVQRLRFVVSPDTI